MKVLVINGPNLNMLGIREPDIYGAKTFKDLEEYIKKSADELEIDVSLFQSNHEGEIVDIIQSAYNVFDGIVINPAAYTHTSVAILDALKSVCIPTVEVHISDISARESFRQFSYVSLVAKKTICGHGFDGYKMALEYLKENYFKKG
jgi:3-dehydroquinate dehydratase-2